MPDRKNSLPPGQFEIDKLLRFGLTPFAQRFPPGTQLMRMLRNRRRSFVQPTAARFERAPRRHLDENRLAKS